jgi:hypothetical protein
MTLDLFDIDVEFSPGEVAIQNFELAESPVDTGDSSELISLGERLASRVPVHTHSIVLNQPPILALSSPHMLSGTLPLSSFFLPFPITSLFAFDLLANLKRRGYFRHKNEGKRTDRDGNIKADTA